MITTEDWLPIGSVIHIEGYEGLVMITTCMVGDSETKILYDYAGVPYPLGKSAPGDDIMFDRDAIDDIFYIGFQDEDGERYQDGLKMGTEVFEGMKATSRGLTE